MEEVIDDLIGKFWTNDRIVELQKLAEEQGWTFTPRERFAEQPTAIKGFQLFKGKRGKRVIGMMHLGQADSTTRIYDYIYYSDGGKRRTTVIELHSPELFVSKFNIVPRNGLKNLFRRSPKLENPAMQAFNKNYQIETANPEATYLEFPDSAMEIMGQTKGFRLEGGGEYLIYYRKGKQLHVNEILEAKEMALQIVEAVLFDREKEFV